MASNSQKLYIICAFSCVAFILVYFSFQRHADIFKLSSRVRGTASTVAVPFTKFVDSKTFNRTWKALLFAHPHGISRIIHQSWKVKKLPSKRMEVWASSWRKCFPTWKYVLWTDEDNRHLVADLYPWFLKKYDSLPSNIMRADVVRYLYMHTFGGIYADLDTECLRPFENLLNASIVFGAMDGSWAISIKPGHIQNSFMYSRPGHSFWLELVNNVYSQQKHGGVEDSTGPLMLIRVLLAYQKRGLKDIQIYPGRYFNPFSWITNKNKNCVIQGGMNVEQYKRCRDSFKSSSYVVQYHTKTWGGGKAR